MQLRHYNYAVHLQQLVHTHTDSKLEMQDNLLLMIVAEIQHRSDVRDY